jgi:hypothetical protein
MIRLRLIPKRFRTRAVCRYFIRRSIHNTKWIPKRVLLDMTFKLWLGVHVSAYSGIRVIEAPEGFSDGMSSIKSSLLVLMAGFTYQQYSALLGVEWLDDVIASHLIELNREAYLDIPKSKLSKSNIARQIRFYPESVLPLMEYMGDIDWHALIKIEPRVASGIPVKLISSIDFSTLFKECPESASFMMAEQLNEHVVSMAIEYCAPEDLKFDFFAHESFLDSFIKCNESTYGLEGAVDKLFTFILEPYGHKSRGSTMAFLSSHGIKALNIDRERVDAFVVECIGQYRRNELRELNTHRLCLALAKEAKHEKSTETVDIARRLFFGDYSTTIMVLVRLFFATRTLDDIAPYVEFSRSEWESLINFYPRDTILNHPEGRRFLLEHEMGL